MDLLSIIALDLVAIAVLAFAVYYPRHRRRDLAIAFVGVNVGVLAVSMVLADTTVSAGLGLGLFGVLSIIRLRSREIEQSEIAYYLAALALGLIAGLSGTATWTAAGLSILIVGVIAIVDSPAVLRRSREQTLILDRAYPDEEDARTAVEETLGTTVQRVTVRNLDLVSDTTTVNVRYTLPRRSARRRTTRGPSGPATAADRDSAPDTVAHTWQVTR
ncbi:DUF4956 domain-containing protein [Microbacterium xanthum]|uniref:DUF4956 domain-containing protein n=1 Tax=Microbacterium xanthum TaxID=3079794 RepID=UPI002AD2B33F|nr:MULTISPECIES: DUF4956 domain-containing protein [unclassified Microbacterium]MDZ8170670.1 DUF4956 domain-containing protein [Microbacterium sp. KSW-48]MDZ8201196.1 DUF4956 domain-containing protein [Microbacterium sp. SSW1-59]